MITILVRRLGMVSRISILRTAESSISDLAPLFELGGCNARCHM